jgi:hypothetical protein
LISLGSDELQFESLGSTWSRRDSLCLSDLALTNWSHLQKCRHLN